MSSAQRLKKQQPRRRLRLRESSLSKLKPSAGNKRRRLAKGRLRLPLVPKLRHHSCLYPECQNTCLLSSRQHRDSLLLLLFQLQLQRCCQFQ